MRLIFQLVIDDFELLGGDDFAVTTREQQCETYLPTSHPQMALGLHTIPHLRMGPRQRHRLRAVLAMEVEVTRTVGTFIAKNAGVEFAHDEDTPEGPADEVSQCLARTYDTLLQFWRDISAEIRWRLGLRVDWYEISGARIANALEPDETDDLVHGPLTPGSFLKWAHKGETSLEAAVLYEGPLPNAVPQFYRGTTRQPDAPPRGGHGGEYETRLSDLLPQAALSEFAPRIAVDLLEDAHHVSLFSNRASLILTVAALEIGVKDFLASNSRALGWLARQREFPPVGKVLRDLLPLVVADDRRLGTGPYGIPRDARGAIKSAIEQRNALVHSGRKSNSRGKHVGRLFIDGLWLAGLIRVARDVLYLLSYYAGEDWALDRIRPSFVATLCDE